MAKAKVTPKRTSYIIANCTAGNIVLPQAQPEGRRIMANAKLSTVILPPGQAITVPAEVWNEMRKNTGVKNYLDHGLLSEVKSEGPINIIAEETSQPVIPENLRRDDEVIGKQVPVRAAVRRTTPQKITVS